MIAGIVIGLLFFFAFDVYIAIELARLNSQPDPAVEGEQEEDGQEGESDPR